MPASARQSEELVSQLDFADFTNGDVSQKADFCNMLVSLLSTVGFVTLINHEITDGKVAEVFEWVSA